MLQQRTTHTPDPRSHTSTPSRTDSDRDEARTERDRLHKANVALVARIERLQATLAGLMNDNRELQRKLKQVRAENQRLQTTTDRHAINTDRHAHIRRMLSERASRNP